MDSYNFPPAGHVIPAGGQPNGACTVSTGDTQSFGTSVAMSSSSHTSPGAQGELMLRQSSGNIRDGSGNGNAALKGFGSSFSGTVGSGPRGGEFTGHADLAGSSFRQPHGSTPGRLVYLSKLLFTFANQAQDIVHHLSLDESELLQKRAQETLGSTINVIQSAIHPLKRSEPARIGKPDRNCRYRCPPCDTKFINLGTFKRHLRYLHVHQYHYRCIDPECDWFAFRKDKVHGHVRYKHRELGSVTKAQIESIETKLPHPRHCAIGGEPVNSWDSFLYCMAAHCELPADGSSNSNGGGDCDTNGGCGDSFNHQLSGMVGPHGVYNGYGNGQAGADFLQSLFGGHIAGPADIHVGSQFADLPGSVDTLASGARDTAGFSEFGSSLQQVTASPLATIENTSLRRGSRPSRPSVSRAPSSLPDINRVGSTRSKRTKRNPKLPRQSEAFKKSCKSCGHSMQVGSNQGAEWCRFCAATSQQLQAQSNHASQHLEYQDFDEATPKGVPMTVNPSDLGNEPMSLLSNGARLSSGQTPQAYGYPSQTRDLRLPIGDSTDAFQYTPLGTRSTEPYFLGMRSGAYGTARVPIQGTSVQPLSQRSDLSSFTSDLHGDTSTVPFIGMDSLEQLALQTQGAPSSPGSSMLHRSISQPCHPGASSSDCHWNNSGSGPNAQGRQMVISGRSVAQSKGVENAFQY